MVNGYKCDLQPGVSKCDLQEVSECDLQRGVSVIIDSTDTISTDDFDILTQIVKLLFPKFIIGRLFLSAQVYYDKCSDVTSAYEEGFYNIQKDFQSRISLLQHTKSEAKFNLNCSLQIYGNIENLLSVSSSENFGIILTKFDSVKEYIPGSETYDGIHYTALLYKSPREPSLRQISKKSSDIPILITELMDIICPKTKSSTDIISKMENTVLSSTAPQQELKKIEFAKSTSELVSLLRYDTLTSTFTENEHFTKKLIHERSFEKIIAYSISIQSGSDFNATKTFLLNDSFFPLPSYLQPLMSYQPLLTTSLAQSLLMSIYENTPNSISSLHQGYSKQIESKNHTDWLSLNTDFQSKLVSQTMHKQTFYTSEIITNNDRSIIVYEVDFGLSSSQNYISTYSQMFTSTQTHKYGFSSMYSPSFSQTSTEYSFFQNTKNIETSLFTTSNTLLSTDSPQTREYFKTISKNIDNNKTPLLTPCTKHLTSISFLSSIFVRTNVTSSISVSSNVTSSISVSSNVTSSISVSSNVTSSGFVRSNVIPSILNSSYSQTNAKFPDDKSENSKTLLLTSFLMYSSVLFNSEITPKVQSMTELQVFPTVLSNTLEHSSIQKINSFILPVTSIINTSLQSYSSTNATIMQQYNNTDATKSIFNISAISSAVLLENISSKNVFIKKIHDFVERKATVMQLKDQNWIHAFVENSSKILTDVGNFNNTEMTSESNELINYIEEVLLLIGANFPLGTNLTYETNEIAFEISSVKPSQFTGYIFKRKNESIQLPHDLFHNSSADSIAIVAMSYKRLPSMLSKRESIRYSEQVIAISTSTLISTPFKTPVFYELQIDEGKLSDFFCVYWNKSDWSSSGCKLYQVNSTLVSCQCNHMTSFSILLQIKSHEISETDQFVLSMITYIGCGASIIGCLALILVYIMCGRLAIIDRNIVHINLAIAIALSNSLFLTADSVFKYKGICLAVSLGLLYSFLATFFWMLVEGIHVYLMVVIVFKSPKRLTVYMIIGWVLPAIIVALAGVRFHKQLVRKDFCWLPTENHMIWFFAAPSLLIMIVNSVVLTSTLKASLKMTVEPGEFKRLRKMARLTLLLMPIFGLTWVFGLLAINKQTIIFQYIFTAINSFQGLFIFICYCLLNNEVKREYVQVKQRSVSYLSSKSTGTTDVGFSSNIHPHQRWRFKDALSVGDSTSVKLTKFKSIQSTPYYQESKDTDIPESVTETLYKKSNNYSIELLKLSQSDDRISVDSNDPILSTKPCRTVGSLKNEPLDINNKSVRQKTFYSVIKAYQF